MQSISGLVTSAVYNSLYPLTLSVWPGLLISVGATVTVSAIAVAM